MKKDIEKLARIFKALGDPHRLAIVLRLLECCGPSCCAKPRDEAKTVSEIAAQLDLSLSTVSHHLKELRAAGLLVCKREGQNVFCYPDFSALEKIKGLFRA